MQDNSKHKNIVICCDGTGNEFGDCNSNVVKLYSTLVQDENQIAYYCPGVGTMGAPNARGRVGKQWSKMSGLAFGVGLLDDVGDAYRYLMENFKDGDLVYLFGFSRGAYTARALAGLLYGFGLLCPGNEQLIPYILRMYSQRSREAKGKEESVIDPLWKRFKWAYSHRNFTSVHFVGVWDTVSSIGWIYDPIVLPFAGVNPIIRTGRQALSLDERRCMFKPRIWRETDRDQDIKQVWFRGVHSDVGGSYEEKCSGHAEIALEWMMVEAREKGLMIDPAKAGIVLGNSKPVVDSDKVSFLPEFARPDPGQPIHHSLKSSWWLLELLPHRDVDPDAKKAERHWSIPLGRYRKIPGDALIHQSVHHAPEDSDMVALSKKHPVEPSVCYFDDTSHCSYAYKTAAPKTTGPLARVTNGTAAPSLVAKAGVGLGVAGALSAAWMRARSTSPRAHLSKL